MITIACVLRSGGDYIPEDVRRLTTCLKKNIPEPWRIVCLTDEPEPVSLIPDVEVHPLLHDWPGWWSKLELFRLAGPVLYLDLDTVVIGPLGDLMDVVSLTPGPLFVLRDFYNGLPQTGIMGWIGSMTVVYETFARRSAPEIRWVPGKLSPAMKIDGRLYRGDAEWLREHVDDVGIRFRFVQDVSPAIVSYKVHCWRRGRPPDGASIVCFHGHPRPSALEPGPRWLQEAWKEV